jgi:SAM-dependent MidA family methyltransferase
MEAVFIDLGHGDSDLSESTSAQHMWELLQDCWKSIPGEADLNVNVNVSWLRECQECAKLSSRQRVATLQNINYQICFDLFKTFLVTT